MSTEIIGIGMVMILPMLGIGWAIYYSWVYTKEIGNESTERNIQDKDS